MNEDTSQPDVFASQRWGLPSEAVSDLAGRLRRTWARFRDCFRTKTRAPSVFAWVYLWGLLTMEAGRTFVNIACRVLGIKEDGQSLQQFMSDSPWSGQVVFAQIQAEIQQRPELAGGC
jgi:SRSO17 transposase